MNSKQYVLQACRFERPDRIPVDYLAHPEADAAFRRRLDVTSEDELLDAIGADIYYLSTRDFSQNESAVKCYRGDRIRLDDNRRTCPLGIVFTRGAYGSKFSVDEAVFAPLAGCTGKKDILAHPLPKAADFDFSPLIEEAERHADRAVIGGLWSGIMGDSFRMYGFERFLTDIAMEPEIIHTLIDRMTDMYLELNDKYFQQLKGKMDIWFFGNDFGSQNGLLIGVDMWREFFFDNIQKLTALAHSYGLKTMMHSCGAITPLIDGLIEAGVDILDPIQVTASGMEPASLSKDFGGRMVFHGGIDTQRVLPFTDPEEVRRHVVETISLLDNNGGYIFAPSQILDKDIPADNMAAMYEAVTAYNAERFSKS